MPISPGIGPADEALLAQVDLVPDARHARRQVRVSGDQGLAGGAALTSTAQLFEPLASAASPSERRTRSTLFHQAQTVPGPRLLHDLGCPPGRRDPRRAVSSGPSSRTMSARSSSRSQLVERPKADSFTSASMSTGRQGSKSRRSSCSSNRSARAQAAALTPAQKASSASRSAGAQGVCLLLRHASQAERAHQTVRGQPLGAGDLGEPAGDDAPVEVDLPEAILTVAEALPEP